MEQEEEVTVAEYAMHCYDQMEQACAIANTGSLTFLGEQMFAECIADDIEQIWLLYEVLNDDPEVQRALG